jgi:hypothetical protein
MTGNGYLFTRDDFPTLLRMPRYPEQTVRQSDLLRAYFEKHLDAFDRVIFEYRVGQGVTPDPTHLPAVQRQTENVTRQRIDVLGWSGSRPTIVEAKDRVTPSALGQILSYRLHLLKEMPDASEPELVVIGRVSDPDTIEPLNAHGITVYLYPATDVGVDAVLGGV